jgi:hypothetical protein
MRRWCRRLRISFVLVGVVGYFGTLPAQAQSLGLGGYGGMTDTAPAGMNTPGPIIPYGGNLGGFMPYRMGGGGTGVSFSTRDSRAMGSGRSSFQLSPISGGMPMSAPAFGQNAGTRTGSRASLFSPVRTGLGGGMNRSMSLDKQSVMPPSFGYPFYQPPDLLGPSSSFMGMGSM